LESMTIDYPAVDVALAGARKHLNSFFPHAPLRIFMVTNCANLLPPLLSKPFVSIWTCLLPWLQLFFFFLLMCFAIHLGGFSFRVWVLCKCAQSCFPLLDKLNAFHALENFSQQISHNSCGVWSNFWDLKFDEMCRHYPREMRWYETGVWSLSFVLWMPDFWLGLWFHCFGTMALTSSIQSGIMTHGNGLAWQPVPLRYVLILSPVTSSIPSFVCKLEHNAWHGLNPLLMSCQKSIATLS
jgi:hypothetical protein